MVRKLGPGFMANSTTYEVQRTNNFEVIVSDLPEILTLAVESFPLPTVSTSPIEVAYGNSKVKVAGSPEFSDGDLVVKDFITADIEKIINDWHRKVYNPKSDKIGWAAEYKKTVTVNEFGPNGEFVRSWILEGAWPSNVAYGDMSYESADKKNITMTLTYDKGYRDDDQAPNSSVNTGTAE
ncbi:tail tube protein [Bacillus phage vB_BceM-HSE3]|nr:tail tube protein [Bacillus phage vB_BceM-HSE3]